jgi:uncharacterized protein (TIGR02598 family)
MLIKSPIKLMNPKILGNAGFSLVEVTLAVGIAALGIIAVLGLMPQGLEMSRKTGELSAQRQITEQIVRNLDQKAWNDLITANTTFTLYYDDQGLETTATAPTQAFIVRVQILPLASLTTLPLGGNGEPYLAKAVIKIATTTNPQFNFADQNNRNYVTMIHYIAKAR